MAYHILSDPWIIWKWRKRRRFSKLRGKEDDMKMVTRREDKAEEDQHV